MTWLKAEIKFGSFFSYRVPDFSSQYALSSLLPAPLTVKLGLVSTAIQYKGINFGKEIFKLIKEKEIGFRIAGKIISNNFLIKRLKAKKGGGGLDNTFGIRGYIFYEEPLEIWFNETKTELEETIQRLRYLGTSDSVCSVVDLKSVDLKPDEPQKKLIFAKEKLDQKKNSLIFPTKDLNKEDTFEDINIYSSKKPRLEKKFFQIPIKLAEQSKNWVIYEIGR